METMVTIGDTVRRERICKAGVTPTTLARIARNESEPHVSTIRKLADVPETSPAILIQGEQT